MKVFSRQCKHRHWYGHLVVVRAIPRVDGSETYCRKCRKILVRQITGFAIPDGVPTDDMKELERQLGIDKLRKEWEVSE